MAASAVTSPALYEDSVSNEMPVSAVGTIEANVTNKSNNSKKLIVVGHRGCGKNSELSIGDVPGTRLSVRENTIKSFNLAAGNGADLVEFDVQVTKDNHPVIFHDDVILSVDGDASRIGDLTLQEFLAFGPQKDGKGGKNMLRREKDGTVRAWASCMEDSLCTLKDAFELVQPSTGFNIEVKFHEMAGCDTTVTESEMMRAVVSAVIADVEKYAKDRTVFFSSFDPDGAILLRREQRKYPVFMVTAGGQESTECIRAVDPRRASVEAAVGVCLQHGLQGVVSEVLAILKNPQLAARVKSEGLSLFTYGDLNNVAEALVQQYALNVDGIIVDCVREIVTSSRTLNALLNFVQPDWSNFLPSNPQC